MVLPSFFTLFLALWLSALHVVIAPRGGRGGGRGGGSGYGSSSWGYNGRYGNSGGPSDTMGIVM